MTKAQGLSLNVVVIAALGIIVLVILVIIFSGKADLFGKSLTNCQEKGGTCSGSCGPEDYVIKNTNCNNDKDLTNDLCCMPL